MIMHLIRAGVPYLSLVRFGPGAELVLLETHPFWIHNSMSHISESILSNNDIHPQTVMLTSCASFTFYFAR